MNQVPDLPVVIVGAGIAGLTAAHRLMQAGIPAIVIEAAARVGGRMSSDILGGHVVDRGAQFLSSEYRLILGILGEMGLLHEVCETSQCSAIVRGGIARPVRANRLIDAIRLFGFRPTLKLLLNTFSMRGRDHVLSLGDYSQWSEFDVEFASTWCNEKIAPEITEYLYEPMLQGFYFQSPEETSAALAVVLTAFGARRARTLSLRSGLGVLPEKMARGLDIRLNTLVSAIECQGGLTLVRTDAGTHAARHVIVAVPAPVANRLIVPSPGVRLAEEVFSLLDTPYRASINIACVTDGQYQLPDNLRSVYGLLIPRSERTAVAAVGIESNKNRARNVPGHALNMMLSNAAALAVMDKDDSVVADLALRSVHDFFPTLAAHVAQTRVYRWPAAEPLSPVGRARALQRYRERCTEQVPALLLAGDYMSMPFTEGAAESGGWAADAVAKSIGNSAPASATVGRREDPVQGPTRWATPAPPH